MGRKKIRSILDPACWAYSLRRGLYNISEDIPWCQLRSGFDRCPRESALLNEGFSLEIHADVICQRSSCTHLANRDAQTSMPELSWIKNLQVSSRRITGIFSLIIKISSPWVAKWSKRSADPAEHKKRVCISRAYFELSRSSCLITLFNSWRYVSINDHIGLRPQRWRGWQTTDETSSFGSGNMHGVRYWTNVLDWFILFNN